MFPGQYFDAESGLHYNYFRDYDPMTGRYIEPDPIGIRNGKNHLYVYVRNNPIIFTDRRGLYGSGSCTYYQQACAANGGSYECGLAQKMCPAFPTGDEFLGNWADCVRQCLQERHKDRMPDKDQCSDRNNMTLVPTRTITRPVLPVVRRTPKILTTPSAQTCRTTMSASIKPSKSTVFAYAIFCLLVLADLPVSMYSEIHMNAYGNTRGIGGVPFRFLPGICLLAFYTYFFYSLIRVGEVRRLAVILHSCVFVVLGLGLAIPFMGLILSLLTPVSLIYRLLMLHLGGASAFPSVVVLAIVFSSINLALLFVALRSK